MIIWEIVGFMVKKLYFYHKKITNYLNKVYFSKVHKPIFILKANQTSSLSIFYDAIY